MCNPLITPPSKYPTSWVQGCWYCRVRRYIDVGAAFTFCGLMYNLFLAEIFCNIAVTHSAIFSTIGSSSGSISQPNLVLHMDFIPQGSQSRCGPRMGYRGIFLKIPPASLELVAFLWGSGSLGHKATGPRPII